MRMLDKKKEYTVIIEKGEEGDFVGDVVELPGCHSQGKNVEELLSNIKEAIQLYLEVEKPKFKTEFIGLQRISL